MDKPNEAIVAIAEENVDLGNGRSNKLVPNSTLQGRGYDIRQTIYAQHLNYILNNFSSYLKYHEHRIEELLTRMDRERVSIGEIIEITGDDRNPSEIKGYGTWEAVCQGLTTVGVGIHSDSNGETQIWQDGDVFGEYKHTITISEMPPHNHNSTLYSHISENTDGGDEVLVLNGSISDSVTSSDVGGGLPSSVIQPTIAVYKWKRTA